PRADDRSGGVRRDANDPETGERGEVALGADVKDGPPRVFGDQGTGDVARGDDGVPAHARHADAVELRSDTRVRTRRIGDERDDTAARAIAGAGVASVHERLYAVMDHAPDVDQPRRRSVGEGGDRLDERDGCGI